jgi:hypothetical protein
MKAILRRRAWILVDRLLAARNSSGGVICSILVIIRPGLAGCLI